VYKAGIGDTYYAENSEVQEMRRLGAIEQRVKG
jgi:hypothetical protein